MGLDGAGASGEGGSNNDSASERASWRRGKASGASLASSVIWQYGCNEHGPGKGKVKSCVKTRLSPRHAVHGWDGEAEKVCVVMAGSGCSAGGRRLTMSLFQEDSFENTRAEHAAPWQMQLIREARMLLFSVSFPPQCALMVHCWPAGWTINFRKL